MKIDRLVNPALLLLTPNIFMDERGNFAEIFRQDLFDLNNAVRHDFVQENRSISKHGVLRGLHYQSFPMQQGKLVRCTQGVIFDVAVDLRVESEFYLKWTAIELNGESCQSLWIPPGFAHGFCVLSESAEVSYRTTNFYSPVHERAISWSDSQLDIRWPPLNFIISEKDKSAPCLSLIKKRQERLY